MTRIHVIVCNGLLSLLLFSCVVLWLLLLLLLLLCDDDDGRRTTRKNNNSCKPDCSEVSRRIAKEIIIFLQKNHITITTTGNKQ